MDIFMIILMIFAISIILYFIYEQIDFHRWLKREKATEETLEEVNDALRKINVIDKDRESVVALCKEVIYKYRGKINENDCEE